MFDALKSVKLYKDYAKINHGLESTIEAMKSAYPHKFLQDHELKQRHFYDQPAAVIPYASFKVPCPLEKVQ